MNGTRANALHAIRAVVGERGVIDDDFTAEPYLIDHRKLYRGRGLVVLPASTDEVAAVVRVARDARIAIVPQGGNTGYCGGATPDDSGEQIVLGLGRMSAVRDLDPVNFTMTAEAGVVLADAQTSAAEHDLLFPLSLGSEGSCQIGGNLSTNAGGLAVLRYGNARDLVLGIEVVLPDGQVWNGLSKLRKDNAGYDLKHLFIGAEGTLGILTAAVLKLFPAPRAQATAFVAVPGPAAACELLARARRVSGDAVTSFEYLPRFALDLVVSRVPDSDDPLDQRFEHYVLIELASAVAESTLEAQLERLLEEGLARGEVLDAAIAKSAAQRERLWRLREMVPEAQRLAGGSYKHDVSVAVSDLPRLLERGSAAARAICPQVRVCGYGHIGDGNLHFNFLPPEGMPLEEFASRDGAAISEAMYDAVESFGGSVCAEHGVGRLKTDLLARRADPVAFGLMRRMKQTLDPQGLMNPGKVLR